MNFSISHFRQKYFGDRQLYFHVLRLVIPMIIQNMVTTFVSLLDNVMVGQVGTLQMSGVSIVNQYMFIFNITIFGALSGPGIFGSQYYGKGDYEGQKQTVRFRIVVGTLIAILGMVIFFLFHDPLIQLFLSPDSDPVKAAETLSYGRDYLLIMIISLFPFAIGQAYTSVIRECGETQIPMLSSFTAVAVNLVLDYALIFGKFGLPSWGVKGAAVATTIAKIIETLIVVLWAHTHHEKNPYIKGLYKTLRIPLSLAFDIARKSIPLMINEFIWSAGMTIIAQCYSTRGLDVVAARNIASTLSNLFISIYVQFGAGIGILVGRKLGAGDLEGAKDLSTKLLVFSMLVSFGIMFANLPFVSIFPLMYNTEESIRKLASFLILISVLAIPIGAFSNYSYFIIRSGGKTGITFLFDFIGTWLIAIPLAVFIGYFTNMNIYWMFTIVTFSEFFKDIAGFFLVKSNLWVNNIIDQ